jgi:hypothetical protein
MNIRRSSRTIQQSNQQLNFRAIAKKESTRVLPPCRPQLNQFVQMGTVQTPESSGSQKGRETIPNP